MPSSSLWVLVKVLVIMKQIRIAYGGWLRRTLNLSFYTLLWVWERYRIQIIIDLNWWTLTNANAGTDWGQEEKGTTEDEMVGWHHWLNGHGFGWTLGVGDGQRDLACCGLWGGKESDTTEQLNWTDEHKKDTEFESLLTLTRLN